LFPLVAVCEDPGADGTATASTRIER